MRKIFIIMVILLLIASTASASVITRTTETEFEGKINYHMVAENEEAVTATKIWGEGTLKAENDLKIKETNLDYKQDYIMIADNAKSVTGRAYKSMEMITVIAAEENVYAIGIKVLGGQHGVFEGDFSYGSLDITEPEVVPVGLTVDTYSELGESVYRRYVNLVDEDISLREVMKAVGTGRFKDQLRFRPVLEVAE